jgi:hypothetical protein
MFEKDYTFYGKHARYVTQLTSDLKDLEKAPIFQKNLDVYKFASVIGIVYGRQGEIDKSKKDLEDEKVDIRKIAGAQMITISTELEYIYELIMINHRKKVDDIEKRIDRAFRYTKNEELQKEGEEIFNSYVLGGVEVLYEKIFKEDTDTDQILANLYDFIEEFNDKYGEEIETLDIDEIMRTLKD